MCFTYFKLTLGELFQTPVNSHIAEYFSKFLESPKKVGVLDVERSCLLLCKYGCMTLFNVDSVVEIQYLLWLIKIKSIDETQRIN